MWLTQRLSEAWGQWSFAPQRDLATDIPWRIVDLMLPVCERE